MRFHSITLIFFLAVLSGCVASTMGMTPYKQETVTTIKGTVTTIETTMNKQTKEDGMHLKVSTEADVYAVHVSPQWYAEKQKFQFNKGELLTITGSTFVKDNEKNIYAATIIDSTGNVIELRKQDTGETLWTGRTRDESLPQKDLDQKEKTQQEMKAKNQKNTSSSQQIRDGSRKGSMGGGR